MCCSYFSQFTTALPNILYAVHIIISHEQEMYSEYGDIYGTSIMGEDELVICDPRVFDTVLRKEGKFPIGGAESATTFVEYYKETNNTMGMKSMSRGSEWKEWRQPLEKDMYVDWTSYLEDIADTANKM